MLSVIEGRSFHHLAAGTRISLAAALRYRREFGEAQRLLNEAEAICDRHHFKDLIPSIARIRSDVERELQVAQAPAHTLPQLIDSLHELMTYRPERAVDYLPFWYFAWQTELLALLRSGPHLSFMVVTDEVERFMRFAAQFRHLADNFLMTTSQPGTIKVAAGVLPIPPTWLFPATFPIFAMKRGKPKSEPIEQEVRQEEEPPNYRLIGPAKMFPRYMLVDAESDVEGEGRVMSYSTSYLPQEAIDLMIHRPIEELIQRRVIWFPTLRANSQDPFLTDLRVGYRRGLFPVYFDQLPTSEAVSVCGGVQINIGSTLLSANRFPLAAKWSRALLKLTKLPKGEAQSALLDLPEVFDNTDDHGTVPIRIEIRLFEFGDAGQRLFHPVLLIRGE